MSGYGMTPEELTTTQPGGSLVAIDLRSQVCLETLDGKMLVTLPKNANSPLPIPWTDIREQLKYRLSASERFWPPGTLVHLSAGDRLVDRRQIDDLTKTLAQAGLHLVKVATSHRQTAVAAAGAGYSVEQTRPEIFPPQKGQGETWAPPLYIKNNVRSGAEVQHPGTIIILGDANPGSRTIAAGDILVMGRLRGLAHAGARGNRSCQIFALQMEASQLRIAEAIARPPDTPAHHQFYPEIAYISTVGIRLARAVNFFKTHSFSLGKNSWVDAENS